MPVVIVVGIQWGDEGKGKVVDYLTERARLVVRFQGGNNAGHTVVVNGQKSALRLIPSGILRPGTRCLLAAGVVLDAGVFFEELEQLKKLGVDVSPSRLGIAAEVPLILPYHRALDAAREQALSNDKIGTTGKGIGPAYEDVVARSGVRVCDLFYREQLQKVVTRNVEQKNKLLKHVFGSQESFDAEVVLQELTTLGEQLKPYVTNVSMEVNQAIREKQFVMFEGAQGSLLDIQHGTYPFVTSSNTVAGFACASAGFGPRNVDHVLGICKAYCTRVGSGPFPTEDTGSDGDRLRTIGNEFGTVTGRPRRCGWFDGVAVKRAIRLNGVNSLFLTKLDVLTGFAKVKLGVSYRLNGKTVDDLPVCSLETANIEAVYEEHEGWTADLTQVRTFSDLPPQAQKLVRRIEEVSECAVGGFSVGPGREQTIVMDGAVKEFAFSLTNV